MGKSHIGLIGLAVMGANLARNIANNGFRVSVYNRTPEVTDEFIQDFGGENLVGQKDLQEFVQSIKAPRKIIVMVKAGAPVDGVIEQLMPFLSQGDTIIDCGNSLYSDTIRREEFCAGNGFNFFGCGVSGGEEGALNGPSIMPGGNEAIWKDLQPILEAISAKDFAGGSCVTYVGENGAGHFVKMVHNGIEYAVMQMMAEAYEILSVGYGLSAPEIADIFAGYNEGKLQSFLFEIAVPILRKKDDLADGYLLDKILDKAGQKGTGRWTAIEGLDRGVGLSTITEAVCARTVSSFKADRVGLAKLYDKPKSNFDLDQKVMVGKLENALYAGMLIAYAQGFQLMKKAAAEQNWNLNFAEIARIWEGGCIIRAQILRTLHEAFKDSGKTELLAIPALVKDLKNSLPDFREVVSLGMGNGIPLFSLGSALSSFEAMTNERNSANFIQGLRDFFGAHTYERIDREGVFHTNWN